MTTLDVQKMRNDVVAFLEANGFKPRDADGTDFEHEDASFPARLRFKVGTTRGEVTVVPVIDGRGRPQPLRVMSASGFEFLKRDMRLLMSAYPVKGRNE